VLEFSVPFPRPEAQGSATVSAIATPGRQLSPRIGEEFLERAHMYAVIKSGGKQYKVAAGEKIKVEQIAADVGQEVVINQVLAVGSGTDLRVGSPLVAGASVKATVVAQGKHDKVHIFKMRRRKHYRKSQGHRQTFTELQISAVTA
jgi:large subunit ribosomal protein L21